MKLDRNLNPNGRGKYALIHMRKLEDKTPAMLEARAGKATLDITVPANAVTTGRETNGQFFVLKYADVFAEPALRAYADSVRAFADGMRFGDESEYRDLVEFAAEVEREADAARDIQSKKLPD